MAPNASKASKASNAPKAPRLAIAFQALSDNGAHPTVAVSKGSVHDCTPLTNMEGDAYIILDFIKNWCPKGTFAVQVKAVEGLFCNMVVHYFCNGQQLFWLVDVALHSLDIYIDVASCTVHHPDGGYDTAGSHRAARFLALGHIKRYDADLFAFMVGLAVPEQVDAPVVDDDDRVSEYTTVSHLLHSVNQFSEYLPDYLQGDLEVLVDSLEFSEDSDIVTTLFNLEEVLFDICGNPAAIDDEYWENYATTYCD